LPGGHIKVLLPSLKRIHDNFGPAVTEKMFSWVTSQMAAMKATVEKEDIDCDLFVTRSFDCYYDSNHASLIKAFLDEQRQAGAKWTQDVQWHEGPNLERVSSSRPCSAIAFLFMLTTVSRAQV
jgi:hypothetical protein